jgi:competence protein ComEC
MFRWLPYPFLRFTPFFILGIGLAQYSTTELVVASLVGLFLTYCVATFFLPKILFSRYHPVIAFVAVTILVLLGILRTQQYDESSRTDHLLHFTDTADYYVGTVVDYPEPKKNSYKTKLEVDFVFSAGDDQVVPIIAEVVLYQPKADSSCLLQFGDRILVKGLPRKIEPPKNPAEFDYRQFLAYQGIYHQQYLRAENWVKIASNTQPEWMGIAGKWRNRCRDIILQYVSHQEAQGIALAITLGLKSHLEREVQTAYAAAGAMHILAVSGLHVGIIYLIVNLLFKPLSQLPKFGVATHALLCILSLWVYAALTGFSPSVQRAAVMFTFVIVGTAIHRQSSIYNTLACSAFFLLWINPYLVYSVGFQLSYLAVFGIVYLQPRIAAWISPNNKLLNYLWELTAVSIAAQLATFPLSLYYFHQFPTYFWLSNIVVIPAALVMLPLGMMTLASGLIVPALAKGVGFLLGKFIELINASVSFIQQLPGSTVEGVSITSLQTWLLYFVIIFLLALFHYRQLRYLTMMVVSLLLVVAIQVTNFYHQSQEVSMTVYHVKDDTHLDFTNGFSNLHLGEWNSAAEYHVLANHIQKGLQTQFLNDSVSEGEIQRRSLGGIELIQFQGKLVAVIHEKLRRNRLKEPIHVNYLIVAKNSVRDLSTISHYFRYDQLIIDGTNSYYVARKLAEEAEQKHIAYHSVPVQGALTIDWKP